MGVLFRVHRNQETPEETAINSSNQALQPTAPLRHLSDVDLSERDSVSSYLRLPEPWLSLLSLDQSCR